MKSTILLACAASVLASACKDPPPPAPPPPPQHYIVAVDLSGSITAHERSANAQLLADFTPKLGFGDRMVVMEAHARGRRDTRRPAVIDIPATAYGGIPTPDDSANATEAIRIGLPRVRQLLASPVAAGTDLFATIHSAAERAREAPGRKTTLVLLSDMLQCASGVCMENGTVPDSAWIDAQRASNLLPDLAGACVVVVGADAATPQGQRVRDFWIRYFHAAGARLRPEKYSYQVTRPEYLAC